jgi:organic hydroperoxide reductase OsmC/OhrA
MPTPLPHHYDVTLDWPGSGPAALGASGRPAITGGAPPEFDGDGRVWSPEHLLLSSLNLCLQTTFEAFARREALRVQSYRSRALGTLARVPGGLGFTDLSLEVTVVAPPGQEQRVQDVLLKAKQHCLVANTLTLPVRLVATVEAAAEKVMAAGVQA